MSIQFEAFRQALLTALNDPNFVRNNSLMQNNNFKNEITGRVTALVPDMNVVLDVTKVEVTSGTIAADQANNLIQFSPSGFSIKLTNVDATVSIPNRIWLRAVGGVTPADGIRYIVTDTSKGILLLGEDLVVRGLFPGLGQQATTGYDAASSTIAFTIGGTEYIAVAMSSHHIVRIYNYTTGALVSTIGTLDVAGSTGILLNQPVDLAFDSVTSRLYVLCKTGMPVGAISPAGFISRYDISIPAAPVLVDIYASYTSNGSILGKQVNAANSIFIEGVTQRLWIANGAIAEIGFIDLTQDRCEYFLGSTSIPGFTFGAVGTLRVKTLPSLERFLYIANGAYGSVLVLNLQTNAVANVFNFTSQVSQLQIYGNYGAVVAAEPDTVTIGGSPKEIVVTLDPTNKRVVSVDEQVYTSISQCTFSAVTLGVPLRLLGYAIAGNVPSDVVLIEFNTNQAAPVWHKLEQITTVSPSTYFQFRMTIRLPMGYPLDNWIVRKVTIIGEQA